MSWTALVPLKLGARRKSRLAGRLTLPERERLSDRMAAHVLDCLAATARVSRVVTLAPESSGTGEWRADTGRGLNAELEAAWAALPGALAIVFGDLPLLSSADVDALLHAAERAGVALAPDRHWRGVNALAIADGREFAFEFGERSLQLYIAQTPATALVKLPGLMHDIDTAEDMEAAAAVGWRCEP